MSHSSDFVTRPRKGTRIPVSAEEMKERSRRMYEKLPEVVERKKQQELMQQRLQRIQRLREQEKVFICK